MGSTLDDLGRYEEAIENYKKASENGNKRAYFNCGLTLENIERFEEAIQQYKEAIKIDPKD